MDDCKEKLSLFLFPLDKLNEPEIFAKKPTSPSLLRSSTFTIASENNEEVKNRNKKRKTLFSFCNKYPRPIFWQFLI